MLRQAFLILAAGMLAVVMAWPAYAQPFSDVVAPQAMDGDRVDLPDQLG
jgi:hypothetical protein